MVKIPVEIATFQNHHFRSLVRVLDHLVTTAVTTPISTEVILAVIKLLVTTNRVTAILVTAILVTAMLCQVKNIVFITRMLKCQCSTSQDSFLLVSSWAIIAKVILVSKKLFCVPLLHYEIYFQFILYQKEVLLLWQNLLNIFLWQSMYFISLKYTCNNIELSAIVIGGFLDVHKAVGRSGREDAFLTHFRVLRGYRFFSIDAFSRPSALIG